MGISTNADRCENVIYLGDLDLGFYDIGDSNNGWRFVASAINCGEKGKFYGDLLMKRDTDLNEKEFDEFINGESDDPYVYLVCGNTVIGGDEHAFSSKREYMEEFKSDFHLYDPVFDIEDIDIITQLI